MQAVIVKALLIYGVAIVVSMLIALVIKGIVVGLGALKSVAVAPAAPSPDARLASDSGVPGEHVAAIAAAVRMMVGVHRVVRIEAATSGAQWVAEGRAAHHASHDVHHPPRR